jgi:hypothetical protein
VILVGVLFAVGYVSFSNQANLFEVSIRNKYENNQNVYDNGFKKVSEIGPGASHAGRRSEADL